MVVSHHLHHHSAVSSRTLCSSWPNQPQEKARLRPFVTMAKFRVFCHSLVKLGKRVKPQNHHICLSQKYTVIICHHVHILLLVHEHLSFHLYPDPLTRPTLIRQRLHEAMLSMNKYIYNKTPEVTPRDKSVHNLDTCCDLSTESLKKVCGVWGIFSCHCHSFLCRSYLVRVEVVAVSLLYTSTL